MVVAFLILKLGRGYGSPPPPDVGVAQPIKRHVTVFSEHLGSTAAFESVEVQARVTGELEQISFTSLGRLGQCLKFRPKRRATGGTPRSSSGGAGGSGIVSGS